MELLPPEILARIFEFFPREIEIESRGLKRRRSQTLCTDPSCYSACGNCIQTPESRFTWACILLTCKRFLEMGKLVFNVWDIRNGKIEGLINFLTRQSSPRLFGFLSFHKSRPEVLLKRCVETKQESLFSSMLDWYESTEYEPSWTCVYEDLFIRAARFEAQVILQQMWLRKREPGPVSWEINVMVAESSVEGLAALNNWIHMYSSLLNSNQKSALVRTIHKEIQFILTEISQVRQILLTLLMGDGDDVAQIEEDLFKLKDKTEYETTRLLITHLSFYLQSLTSMDGNNDDFLSLEEHKFQVQQCRTTLKNYNQMYKFLTFTLKLLSKKT